METSDEDKLKTTIKELITFIIQNNAKGLREELNNIKKEGKIQDIEITDIEASDEIQNVVMYHELPLNNLKLLHVAALVDSLECFMALFERTKAILPTADILMTTDDKYTTLHYAVLGSSLEITQYIFANTSRESINDDQDDSKVKPLMYLATVANSKAIVEFFLNNNIRFPIYNRNSQFDALTVAVVSKKWEILELLLRNHTNSSHQNSSILKLAMDIELDSAILPLLEFGIDPNERNERQDTPLVIAIKKKKFELVKILVEKGAYVNVPTNTERQYPLHFAVEMGNISVIEYLLKKDADPNQTDKNNCTPIFYIMKNKQKIDEIIEIVQLLIYYGAKLNIKDASDVTILYKVLTDPDKCEPNLIRILVDNDAKVDIKISIPNPKNGGVEKITILQAIKKGLLIIPEKREEASKGDKNETKDKSNEIMEILYNKIYPKSKNEEISKCDKKETKTKSKEIMETKDKLRKLFQSSKRPEFKTSDKQALANNCKTVISKAQRAILADNN